MKRKKQHIDYTGLAKMFAGHNWESDTNLINYDIFGASENEMKACMDTWKTLDKMQEIEQFDTDNAWGKLHSRLENDSLIDTNKSEKIISINRNKWMAVAASIIILVGLFSVWFVTNNNGFGNNFAVENTNFEAKEVNLPDGSVVYLNTHSKLTYPKAFTAKKRSVELDGEAFFDVKRDESKPFEIIANRGLVKVLGTSFNVSSLGSSVEVIVKTGKVSLADTKELTHSITLIPGERGLLSESVLKKESNDRENYLSWLDGNLVFKAVPLNEALVDINNTFHCKIELGSKELDTLPITTNFSNNTLDEVLEAISLAFDLKVEKTGKKYILVSN